MNEWMNEFAQVNMEKEYHSSRSSKKPVIDPTKPLSPQATFRGPYINTGSRDVGPDHQTYTKKWFILNVDSY